MSKRPTVSYIFLLLLITFCFTSRLDGDSQISDANDENDSTVSVPDLRKTDPKAANPKSKGGPGNVAKTADRILEYMIYISLSLSGFYVCFSGFKTFRLTMVILGFYVAYYVILFALTEADMYKGDNVGHQLGLFFGSLVLGFILSVLCYIFDRANFVIFGTAVSCMAGLVMVQLLIDIRVADDAALFFIVLVACAVIFSIVAFFVLDHFIIWGFGFVGGVITPVNIMIMFQFMTPFENRAQGQKPDSQVMIQTLAGIFLLTIAGITCQYFLRRRLIKKWTDDGEEENPRQTFLDEKF